MNKKGDLHNIQMLILKKLLFLPHARFRDMKIEGLTTDHLTYHINTLVKQGFLQKDSQKRYTLTDMGKEFSNRMDERNASIERQGKRGALVRVSRMNGKRHEFLFMKRLKQPFYGCVGFHTGKIREGETILDAANRELKEETGLTAKLYFVGVIHYVDYKPDGEFLRDIYFYTFDGYSPKGDLIVKNKEEGVENFWATMNAIKEEKAFPGFWDNAGGISWFNISTKPPRNKKYLLYEKVRVIESY
jgi:8-oxo-dGTP pyrophosphatase MutT (NUDIX family)